ncbi:MAG: hypothetical protein NT062_06480 [Proteobacteria bacterium]|nr:hypothetical protein [Pseudomonadota bacterium]
MNLKRGVWGMLLLASGCYMDATAGVAHAQGGVKGLGWELGLVFGVGWDIGGTIRPSVGYGADMTHVGASDGKYGTTGMSLHARTDLALAHGERSSVRAVFDYGRGRNDELHFTGETDPTRYIGHAVGNSVYAGIAAEWDDPSGVAASYGIGPHVTWHRNDFVGDTNDVGLQMHASFWWVPQLSSNSHGSLSDHMVDDSPPTQPLPTGTPIPTCEDSDGHRHPCY